MKVELLRVTLDPEALIAQAYGICTGKPTIPLSNIAKLMEKGHETPVEHATCSFRIEGISRACSHQLVRHRLASYSQESQRYVSWKKIAEECLDRYHDSLCSEEQVAETMRQWFVQPASMSNQTWIYGIQKTCATYLLALQEGSKPEDARFLLPNAATAKLLMTFNFREALLVFRLRISPRAQWEIRGVCVRMLELLHPKAPHVFGDIREELRTKYPSFFEGIE